MHDVSIIIPCFDKVDFTLRCLQSLAEHTPPDRYEVVLVDNASSDATPDLCAQLDGDVVVIRNDVNLGFSKACNQGAAAASGRYLLFLNNDTEAHAGWLEPLLHILDTEPDVGAVGSKLLFPDGTLQHAGVSVAEVEDGVSISATHDFYQHRADTPQANVRRDLDVVTGACVAMRREAFEPLGGFDEEYWNGYEDVDLCLGMRELGWRIVYEPASVLTHHESVSGRERFVATDANIERLQARWTGRYHPDTFVTVDQIVRPHPRRCRVHVVVAGEASDRHTERTLRRLERMLRPRDELSSRPEVAPGDVDPTCFDADWVLVIRAGLVPHHEVLDRLLLAELLGFDQAGPSLDRPGTQNHRNFAQTTGSGMGARVAALARVSNRCAPVERLDPDCRMLTTRPTGGSAIVVPTAYVDTSAVPARSGIRAGTNS